MKVMNKNQIVKVVLHFLIYAVLLVLFTMFFLIDQYRAFFSGRSAIAIRNAEVNVLEFPTITVCLDPATKASVSQKYGFENIYDKFDTEVQNSKLYERFDKMEYQL